MTSVTEQLIAQTVPMSIGSQLPRPRPIDLALGGGPPVPVSGINPQVQAAQASATPGNLPMPAPQMPQRPMPQAPIAQPQQQGGLLSSLMGPEQRAALMAAMEARNPQAGFAENLISSMMGAERGRQQFSQDKTERAEKARKQALENRLADLRIRKAEQDLRGTGEVDKGKIVEGADGFKYWSNTGERAFPDITEEQRAKAASTKGTRITLNTGDQPVGGLPKLSKGHTYKFNDKNELQYDSENRPIVIRIPDTPADIEFREEAARKAKAAGVQQAEKVQFVGEIDDLIDTLESEEWSLPTAGFGAETAARFGTKATAVAGMLERISGKVARNTLQEMRDASKTGGALGQVTQKELDMLKAADGALNQNLPKKYLLYNLARLKEGTNAVANVGLTQDSWDEITQRLARKYEITDIIDESAQQGTQAPEASFATDNEGWTSSEQFPGIRIKALGN